PTAELAFALMANLARRISECDKKLRIPGATRWGVLENLGNGLYGKRIGIIGMGRIGQSIAKRALAAGMTICYNNRHQLDKATEEKYNAQYVSFDELIAKSEYISISTPLTEETHHLIDKDAFAKMRRDVNIVNTARGAIIKEKDLAEALTTKRIAGAALDVYEFEPQITQELLSLDNVVMVPHIGTATISARNEISKYACENIMRFFKGEKPLSRVI
ncbi:MAG: NAD(P)-binding domain-containing protein, partial [Paludibacteraceae bacterium]|nr:NAD(P)-binding domain-containing protein [Paludibacteraceae bacterium]